MVNDIYYLLKNAKYEYCTRMQDLPRIKTVQDSISFIGLCNKSLARFGDGEFMLMFGKSLGFQSYDKALAARLFQIVTSKVDGLAIGIPGYFGQIPSSKDTLKKIIRRFLVQHRTSIYSAIDFDLQYYDTLLSQWYALNPNDSELFNYFQSLRKLWDGRDVYLCKGVDSELGQERCIYDNASSIETLLLPSRNAYSEYQKILNKIGNNHEERLVILALGPTATVLAYDLHLRGVRALDLGHLSKSYDWFFQRRIVGEDNEPFFPV